jgi:hypothetical protein
MTHTHETLILGMNEDFPEPSMKYFLQYVIKKTGLNEAELWTCRGTIQPGSFYSVADLHWDRIPTKEEDRLQDELDRCPAEWR